MEFDVKEISKYRFSKAISDLYSAKENFLNDNLATSINRSYYSMFHAARALLALEMLESKKHTGLVHLFNEKFITSGKIDRKYFTYLATALNVRMQTDYHDFYVITRNDAEIQLENAEEFLKMVENYLTNVLEK